MSDVDDIMDCTPPTYQGEEVEDDLVGEGEREATEVENEVAQEAVRGAVGGRGRRKAPLSRGRGRKGRKQGMPEEEEETAQQAPPKVNMFEAEDRNQVETVSGELRQMMKGVMQCAQEGLTGYDDGSKSKKKELKKELKKFHKLSMDVVGARLKLEPLPDLVQKVYEELDLETLANKEDDDEQFMALLDQFEQTCMTEAEKVWEGITEDVIDKDEEYQDSLEVLNKFLVRSSSASEPEASMIFEEKKEPDFGTSPTPSGASVVEDMNDTENSEGFELLTEYIPIHDPITKKAFTQPVVNKHCKHVYEYMTIVQMMQCQSGGPKCPYVGCTNRKRVSYEDLEDDQDMTRKIMIRIRAQELD